MEISRLAATVVIDDAQFQRAAREDDALFKRLGQTASQTQGQVQAFGGAVDASSASLAGAGKSAAGYAASVGQVATATQSAGNLFKTSAQAARELSAANERAAGAARETAAALKTEATAAAEAARMEQVAADRARMFAEDLARVAWGADKAAASSRSLGERIQTVGGTVADIGRGLTVGVTLPLLALGAGSIKAATEMEALKAGLTSITGSASETDRQLSRLKEIAKLPGLGFQEAVQGSVRLQAAGLSADLAEKSLKSFGNAIAAVGGGKAQLDTVTLALSQIAAAGKVTADNVNQISNSVPQVRQAMKEAFGTANTEELQAMGIGAEEFVTKISGALAKIKPVGETAKNNMETASDEIQQSLAKVGNAILPLEASLLKGLVPAITATADAFSQLPNGQQQAILLGGAVLAAVGPAASGIAGLVLKAVQLKEALIALGVVRAGATAVSAAGAAGAAGTAGTLAEFAGVGAAAAGGGAMLAGAPIAATLGLGAAALVVGGGIGYGIDQVTGGRERDQRVKAANNRLDAANQFNRTNSSETQNDRRKAAGLPYFDKSGKLVRPAAEGFKRDTATADEKAAKLRASASDAQFAVMMRSAANSASAGPEGYAAEREAAASLPLITTRRKELAERAKTLEPKVREDAEAARDYWALQRDDAELQSQAIKLKADVAKEAEARRKTAEQASKQYRDNVRRFEQSAFRERVTALEAQVTDAAEGQRASARAGALYPVLEERQSRITGEIRALQPSVKDSWDAANRVQELKNEWADLERQQAQLGRSAAEEAANNAKKAEQETKRTNDAWVKFRKDYAAGLERSAKDAEQQFKTANSDRISTMDAHASLQGARLKNLTGVNDPQGERRQREVMVNMQIAQLRELARPVQGQTWGETLKRMTEVETLKGGILDTAGLKGDRRGIGLVQLDQLANEAQNHPFQSRALAEAQRHAEEAKRLAPAPVVAQLVIAGELTPQKLWDAFQRMRAQESAAAGLAGGAF